MIFEIRRAQNGYILKVRDKESGPAKCREIVYQERHDDEIECFADFLQYLNEEYGPSTNRYSAKRIYINVAPGDKYEPASGNL